MRENMPSEEGLLLRSLRNVAQGSRLKKAGAIALCLCNALLLFRTELLAQTTNIQSGPLNPSVGAQAATHQRPAVDLAGGDKGMGGGAAPTSLSDAMVVPAKPPPRLLWEVNTAGGLDYFSEILPAGDRLVAMRRGVLYGLDARTGATCWRYPLVGTVHEPHGPNDGLWADSLIAVRGDRAIIVPSSEGRNDSRPTLIEVSLKDGRALREYYAKLTFSPAGIGWEHPTGPLYPVFAVSEDRKRVEISVIDLDQWCESARFSLDGSWPAFIQARGSLVYLIATRGGEPFSRIITVDLDRQTMRSLPMRCPRLYMDSQVLPDGTFLLAEGRFNAACGYTGAWPHLGALRVGGDAVCIRDAFGLIRVDPRDASILWRCPVPWPRKRLQIGRSARSAIAVGNGIAAFVEDGSLYVVNAATGKLCAAIRTGAVFGQIEEEQRQARLACDATRVYLALPSGLRAFSTHTLDPNRPDPADSGDPAHYLARGRDALRTGDFEGALRALQGIGVAAGLRKESRDEAAALLSQLARSPATVLQPDLWHEVMMRDGWIAGELFAEEYTRLRSPGPLISIGTRRSLAAAAGMLEDPNLWGQLGEDAFLAGEAARILTGVCPVEKHLGEGKNAARVEFCIPIDEETFSLLLPRFRAQGPYLLEHYSAKFSPTQVCQLAEGALVKAAKHTPRRPFHGDEFAEGDTPLVKAAKLQMESMARGAGSEEKIVITRPEPPPARDDGVF
ncbi:MAG: PQQ-binding-like beta-propeller repeat protein [bacterium]